MAVVNVSGEGGVRRLGWRTESGRRRRVGRVVLSVVMARRMYRVGKISRQ